MESMIRGNGTKYQHLSTCIGPEIIILCEKRGCVISYLRQLDLVVHLLWPLTVLTDTS